MVDNLVDIHTHIIPDVDDGAQSVSDSEAMLTRYEENGFTTIIATPHCPVVAESAYEEKLKVGYSATEKLGETSGIRILRGREVRLTPEVELKPGSLKTSSLAGTSYVLVDFPSGSWPHYAEDALFQLQTLGYVPILAHPERYGWSEDNSGNAKDLVHRGIRLQVTLGSFVGMFGRKAQRTAEGLLKAGLVHFVATDAHGPGGRMDAAAKGIDWLQQHYGEFALQQLLSENPQLLLSSEDPLPLEPQNKPRRWQGIGKLKPKNFRTLASLKQRG